MKRAIGVLMLAVALGGCVYEPAYVRRDGYYGGRADAYYDDGYYGDTYYAGPPRAYYYDTCCYTPWIGLGFYGHYGYSRGYYDHGYRGGYRGGWTGGHRGAVHAPTPPRSGGPHR